MEKEIVSMSKYMEIGGEYLIAFLLTKRVSIQMDYINDEVIVSFPNIEKH